ncbi:hypothetical protein BDZ89DRAFT_1113694, partial [Hymenopellis radicata]
MPTHADILPLYDASLIAPVLQVDLYDTADFVNPRQTFNEKDSQMSRVAKRYGRSKCATFELCSVLLGMVAVCLNYQLPVTSAITSHIGPHNLHRQETTVMRTRPVPRNVLDLELEDEDVDALIMTLYDSVGYIAPHFRKQGTSDTARFWIDAFFFRATAMIPPSQRVISSTAQVKLFNNNCQK